MNSVVLLLIFFIPFFVFSQENPDEYEESFEEIFIEDDGITVVGTLQTSQQMAVIDRKEIEMRNAADLAALLQEALNVNIVRYGPFGNQAGVNLRGFDSKRLAFLVDGVPVNSSIDGKFDLNQIDLHSVERIEIIYGGSDSKYNISGALGGIVNIVTVKKQNPGLKFNAAISNTSVMPGEYRDRNGKTQPPRWEDLLDTQNYSAAAAYGSKAFSFTVAANANRAANHFVFKDFLHNTRRKDNNEFWNTGFSSSLVWELPELQKIIASSNVYYGSGNFPASGFSAIYGTQNDLSLSQKLMLDAPRAFHDSLSCEASIAWLYNRRDYYSPNSALSRHNQNSLNAVNRWSWFPAEPFVVRSGLDYRLIFLDSTEIGSRIRHDGGFYLTLEYKAANAFIIVPSVKTVFTGTGEKTVTAVPKLGLAWNVTEKIALKNNYFRIFKFPDFEELYWSGGEGEGNPDLRPEDGWGADIGITWKIKTFKTENIFFAHWTKDSIHWYSKNNSVWRPENVGEAFFWGLENKFQWEIPLGKRPFTQIVPALSYQYIASYLLSYGYAFADRQRVPYCPEHTIGMSLGLHWKTGLLLIWGNFESLKYHDTLNHTVLSGRFLANVSVNQDIGKRFTVFAALKNILNSSYESFYDYPMPGITLDIGLRIKLEAKNE